MSIPTWLEYANAVATSAAAFLAAGAIIQSSRNSNENQKALIRERRIDFELDVLAELSELNTGSSNVATRDARMKARAAMLDVDTIPLTRAAFGLESTTDAITRIQEPGATKAEQRLSLPDLHKKEIAEEIILAIKKRLADRQ